MYSLQSQVRSDVHHFLAYDDGLAFDVSVCTASETINVSRLICFCILPSVELVTSLAEIISRILFHGAFLNKSLFSLTYSGTAMSNVVSIAS